MFSHYRTLGIDPDSDGAAIRSAYLTMIRRYHPDKGGDEADPARAQAVTAAWDVLRDPARRAAYDETLQARFQPDIGGGASIIGSGTRVRGGAAGRNIFLLLAAGTVGLGYWAVEEMSGTTPVTVAKVGKVASRSAPSEPSVRPDEKALEEASRVLAEVPPRLPDARPEPEIDVPVVFPPLPSTEPARMPVRTAVVQPTPRRTPVAPGVAPERPRPAASPPRQKEQQSVVTATAPAPASSRIDLAPLERHLQLLTDQSIRFGNEAKRTRLFATRETFLKRLRSCDDDQCRRDAYLRRNAEVGEIMRN